jgi:hypothetical protein
MAKPFATLLRDKLDPNAWRVEMIDTNGSVEIGTFSGPHAKQRAERYGDKEYDGNYNYE